MEVYRLHSIRFPANSGTGAALHGGRWNPPGVEAIYTAESRALAALEVLVHYAVLPRDYVLTRIRIPEDRVTIIRLEADWLFLKRTRDVGQQYLPKTAVLGVYSAIIPEERIYILNPAHPEFMHIEFLAPEPFVFDPRLKRVV